MLLMISSPFAFFFPFQTALQVAAEYNRRGVVMLLKPYSAEGEEGGLVG